ELRWCATSSGPPPRPRWVPPTWRGKGLVRALAEGVYQDRAFDRLPIIADALEEAGCADALLPGHRRGPGPHARGCVALEPLLGRLSACPSVHPSPRSPLMRPRTKAVVAAGVVALALALLLVVAPTRCSPAIPRRCWGSSVLSTPRR